MRQLTVTLKKQMIVCGLVLGLFTSTAYARTATGDVQAALDQLYPNQGWVAANVGDATSSVLSGLSGTSIRTHPTGSSSSNSPATLTRKMLITGIDPELHLKVHCYSGGDWVLKVLVNGVQLGAGITVNSTTSVDYRFSLVAYVNTEVTLQLQNAAGGAKPWFWEVAYWDLIEIVDGVTATWTNAAGDGNPMNPENWACTNSAGAEVTSVIPTNMMVVRIPNGCTNSFPAGGAFSAHEVKLPATLGADNLDWCGITAPLSGTLDLNGKNLTVSQLKGTATITDTSKKYELLNRVTCSTWVGQRIDSKVKLQPGFTVKADFEVATGTSESRFLLGSCENTASAGRIHPIAYNTKSQFFIGYGTTDSSPSQAYALNTRYYVESFIGATEQTLKVNGVQWARTTVNPPPTATKNAYIFASNKGGTITGSCGIRLYRMTILDGDTVLREFVPARRVSDKEVGLLDLAHLGSVDANNPEFYTCTYGYSNRGILEAGAVTNYIYAAGAAIPPGELHVNVPSGETMNSTVALAGGLKLVKEGAGTFTAAKTDQAYFGGTEVAGGLLALPAANTAAAGCLGRSDGEVRVAEGATLELNGNTGFNAYSVVLAGGTLRNGTVDTSDDLGTVGRITLEADSTEAATNHLTHTGLIDLNGHTLTACYSANGHRYDLTENGSFTNGTVNIVSCGWFRNLGDALDMRTVNMSLKAAINLANDVKVRDLELLYTADYGTGEGRFLIYGTYKAGNYHRKCELQNGSTLDLGGQTGVWPVESTFDTSEPLAFADGARITVKLGNRKVKSGPIVTWQAANKPDDSVTFVLDPALLNARVVRKPGGLWLQTGLLIRIR